MPDRMRYVGAVALLLVAGCSAQEPAEVSPPPVGREPAATAPAEALATAPTARAGDDARSLLAPGGDRSRLANKVPTDLADLVSVHVEIEYVGVGGLRFSFDVDDQGRCSGEIEEAGVGYHFVTTGDGRMLVTADEGAAGRRLGGRWLDVSDVYVLARSCPGGPLDAVLGTIDGAGSHWAMADATRVGAERIAGRQAVHFRKSDGTHSADTWIAADGSTTRLLKLVVRGDDGSGRTVRLSEFDTAGPIEPEPAADLVITPDQSAV